MPNEPDDAKHGRIIAMEAGDQALAIERWPVDKPTPYAPNAPN